MTVCMFSISGLRPKRHQVPQLARQGVALTPPHHSSPLLCTHRGPPNMHTLEHLSCVLVPPAGSLVPPARAAAADSGSVDTCPSCLLNCMISILFHTPTHTHARTHAHRSHCTCTHVREDHRCQGRGASRVADVHPERHLPWRRPAAERCGEWVSGWHAYAALVAALVSQADPWGCWDCSWWS